MTAWGAPPVPDKTPYMVAEDVLERLVTAFMSAGIALPARQFIYLNPPPYDCEQVVVDIGTINPTPAPIEGMFTCFQGRWAVNIGISIARKTCAVAQGKAIIPSAASMQQAAKIASDDATVLMNLITSFDEVGTIELTMNAPGGGLQVVTLDFQLPITGGY